MAAGAQRLGGRLVPAVGDGAVRAGEGATMSLAAQAALQREAASALDPHQQVAAELSSDLAAGICEPGVDEAAAGWRVFEHRDRATELAEEAVRRLEEESDSSDGMAVSG